MENQPVALVTGANKGIGLQIAKGLASHGFNVLLGARNLENGIEAAETISANAHAVTLAFTIAHEPEGINVNVACPGYTATALNDFTGGRTVEQGAHLGMELALLGADGPSGTFLDKGRPGRVVIGQELKGDR